VECRGYALHASEGRVALFSLETTPRRRNYVFHDKTPHHGDLRPDVSLLKLNRSNQKPIEEIFTANPERLQSSWRDSGSD
jgi:hypothetical protein